jgi:hypothetical protein
VQLDLVLISPRSGRERKAWGASPGKVQKYERARETGEGVYEICFPVTRFAGSQILGVFDLGLTRPGALHKKWAPLGAKCL